MSTDDRMETITDPAAIRATGDPDERGGRVSTWNYRITRETITNPDGTTEAMYACREVHYDDGGKVTAWSATPTTFVGDTPGEVCEDLLRAAGSFGAGVLDLDTRETVRVTHSGREAQR